MAAGSPSRFCNVPTKHEMSTGLICRINRDLIKIQNTDKELEPVVTGTEQCRNGKQHSAFQTHNDIDKHFKTEYQEVIKVLNLT